MKQRDVFILFTCTFVLVVAWIGFNLYHSYTTSKISETQAITVTPIDPTFDTKVISTLKLRKQVLPLFEGGGSSSGAAAIVAVPTPTTSIVATPTPSVSVATPSAATTAAPTALITP